MAGGIVLAACGSILAWIGCHSIKKIPIEAIHTRGAVYALSLFLLFFLFRLFYV